MGLFPTHNRAFYIANTPPPPSPPPPENSLTTYIHFIHFEHMTTVSGEYITTVETTIIINNQALSDNLFLTSKQRVNYT